MRLHTFPAIFLAAVTFGLQAMPVPAVAAVKSEQKIFGEPQAEMALLYLIREKRHVGSARTMFVYADEVHLATLDNNCYSFVHVEPGERLLWLNWTAVTSPVEFEAGETYFFRIRADFEPLSEVWGKALIDEVGFHCTTNSQERSTARQQIQQRHAKAVRAAADSKEFVGSEKKRDKRVAKWPQVDLSDYPVLCVEDFEITDPDAYKRKDRFSVESAPERIADRVARMLESGPFEQIMREPPAELPSGTVVLRAEITRYKPEGQSMKSMLVGAGGADLSFHARLVDAATGEELARFTAETGGREAFGIEQLEQNMAYELSLYLRQRKG